MTSKHQNQNISIWESSSKNTLRAKTHLFSYAYWYVFFDQKLDKAHSIGMQRLAVKSVSLWKGAFVTEQGFANGSLT